MISLQCFTREWISGKSREIGAGDTLLVEKTIHAFALLGHLAKRDVPLVFKGGTSLLLRLPRIRRLSIDIDIMCPLPDAELDEVLVDVAAEAPFERYEEDDRGANRLPERRHFKFHYQPVANWGKQTPHVVLDVVKEEHLHPSIEAVTIRSPLFAVDEEVTVMVPTIEGLLGDKLTAFAPNTVGVPLRRESAMQVIKQLFDVAELFDATADLEEVDKSYTALFGAENRYRGSRFTKEQALDDSIETATLVCGAGLKGAPEGGDLDTLLSGGRALAGHLTNHRFGQPEMKIAAAKAACLAGLLRSGSLPASGVRRYDPARVAELQDIRLPGDSYLWRLKKTSPEAFHYLALGKGAIS